MLERLRRLPFPALSRGAARSRADFSKLGPGSIVRVFPDSPLFVGSGVVEAGCKTIIGLRLKQSGMRWTVNHANAIIALRCCELSGGWEAFWEQRAVGGYLADCTNKFVAQPPQSEGRGNAGPPPSDFL